MARSSNGSDTSKTPNEQAIDDLNHDIRNINSAIKQDEKIMKDLAAISQEKAGLESQIPGEIAADITAGKAKLEERYKELDETLIPWANSLLNDYTHEKHFDGVQISDIMIANSRRNLDKLIEEKEKIESYFETIAKIEQTNRKINDIEELGISNEIETLNGIKARHEQEMLFRQQIIAIDEHLEQNAQILTDREAIAAQKAKLESQIPQEIVMDMAAGKKMLQERYGELDEQLIPQANSLLHDYTHEKYYDGVQISEIMILDAQRRLTALVEEREKIDAYLAIVAKIEECNRKLADIDRLNLAKENENLMLARGMLLEQIDALRYLALQSQAGSDVGAPTERAIGPNNGGASAAGEHEKVGAGKGPKPVEPEPAPQKKELNEKEIIDRYVKLLRAKEKVFRGKKSQGIIEQASEIRRDFKELVDQKLSNSQNKQTAIKGVYKQITDGLVNTRRPIEKFLRWMRKPKVAIGRAALGLGIAGVAALIGGVAAIPLLATAGIIGAAGRFVGTTGAFDIFHSKVTGRKSRNENGLGVQVMHNNQNAINDRVATAFTNADNASTRMDEGMYTAARKYRSYKVWKTAAAAAFAIVPLAGSIMDKFHLFGHGGHAVTTPGTPAPATVSPTVAPGETFVVPDNGGVWHIAQQALAQHGVHNNVWATDRLKDLMLQDPEKFGLAKSEIIPRAVERGGFWLHRGADAVIPKSVIDSMIAEADKFATAKKIAAAAVKGAVHVARAKVAV